MPARPPSRPAVLMPPTPRSPDGSALEQFTKNVPTATAPAHDSRHID